MFKLVESIIDKVEEEVVSAMLVTLRVVISLIIYVYLATCVHFIWSLFIGEEFLFFFI